MITGAHAAGVRRSADGRAPSTACRGEWDQSSLAAALSPPPTPARAPAQAPHTALILVTLWLHCLWTPASPAGLRAVARPSRPRVCTLRACSTPAPPPAYLGIGYDTVLGLVKAGTLAGAAASRGRRPPQAAVRPQRPRRPRRRGEGVTPIPCALCGATRLLRPSKLPARASARTAPKDAQARPTGPQGRAGASGKEAGPRRAGASPAPCTGGASARGPGRAARSMPGGGARRRRRKTWRTRPSPESVRPP